MLTLTLNVAPIALARKAAKIPEATKLFFAGTEERPTEAPYVRLQKKFWCRGIVAMPEVAPRKNFEN